MPLNTPRLSRCRVSQPQAHVGERGDRRRPSGIPLSRLGPSHENRLTPGRARARRSHGRGIQASRSCVAQLVRSAGTRGQAATIGACFPASRSRQVLEVSGGLTIYVPSEFHLPGVQFGKADHDLMTEPGARELARRIVAYWASRGCQKGLVTGLSMGARRRANRE